MVVEVVFLCIVAAGAVLGLRIPLEQPVTALVLAVGTLVAVAIAVALRTPPEPHLVALQVDMAPIAAGIAGYALLWVPIALTTMLRGRATAVRSPTRGQSRS
jgi:hypothetical protein